MFFGYEITILIWYFIVYSFLGWCVEVIYCTVNSGRVENRGFLDGPVCPIYGCGMLLVLMLIRISGYQEVIDCPVPILFVGGMVLASSIELFAGWLLMKLFHMRWWDYTMRPFNIGGYICLQFSLAWGLASVLTVKLVHIPLTHIIEGRFFSGVYCLPMLVACIAVYTIDFIATVKRIIGINRSIARFEEVNQHLHEISEGLSQKLGTRALEMEQHIDEERVQRALAKMELEDELEQIFKTFEGNRFMGIRKIMHIQRMRRNERVQRIWDWHLKMHK